MADRAKLKEDGIVDHRLHWCEFDIIDHNADIADDVDKIDVYSRGRGWHKFSIFSNDLSFLFTYVQFVGKT